jgi:hypothetical protein
MYEDFTNLLIKYGNAFAGNDLVKPFLECLDLVFDAVSELVHSNQLDIFLLVVFCYFNVATIRLK